MTLSVNALYQSYQSYQRSYHTRLLVRVRVMSFAGLAHGHNEGALAKVSKVTCGNSYLL